MTTATKTKECDNCGGEGEVREMDRVCASEPHLMADVGSAPCPDCSPPRRQRDY